MKVAKVDSARVAVVSKKLNGSRVVLYASSPNKNFKDGTVEKVVTRRVESANRLYGVFFRGDGKARRLPNGLEDKFTWLMSSLEMKHRNQIVNAYKSGNKAEITQCINNEIEWLRNIKRIEKLKWDFKEFKHVADKSAEFSELKCGELTEEVLNDVIVRMRKALKRGTNKRIVKRLLKALAQGDRDIYANAVLDLKQTDKEALMKYIDSVNRDYYKTNVLSSLAHHDVKVQVNDELLDLASVNNSKGNKGALTRVLEEYASSPEAAIEVLLEAKKVLFEYFFSFEEEGYGAFFTEENLWKIPSEEAGTDVIFGGFFDEGFEVADQYADDATRRVPYTIEEICRETKLEYGKLRARVRFVNYGKYLQLIANMEEDDETEKFWLNFVKEYVEKNYVKKQRTDINAFRRIVMFKECWKETVRYLCGKYIDLGKAVYHFAMPEKLDLDKSKENRYGDLRPEYAVGISSFAYEAIKAEETIQRDVANSTVAALSAFSRCVLDYEKQKECGKEDVLFIKKDELPELLKGNALKQILRYYGGQSEVKEYEFDEKEIVQEILGHFDLIRNENFHYTAGKVKNIEVKNTIKLWENDLKAYAQVVREKYYSNNTALFYPQAKIVKLVEALYRKKKVSAEQVPAFRTIWQRKELPAFINKIDREIHADWLKDLGVRTKYEGALYFLLKEIYYNDFIHNGNKARELFLDAVKNYKGTNGVDKSKEAAENFKSYVKNLEEQKLSFGQICQMILMEYNQQNANVEKDEALGKKEVYSHFKMLLPLCLKNAYQKYLAENYKFLYEPIYDDALIGEPEYLDDVNIDCGVQMKGNIDTDEEKRRLAWFTFAHFVHPKQLNFLIGDFKSYIQYREDVLRRARYAKQYASAQAEQQDTVEVENSVKRAKSILEVLEFVRPLAGRVSNVFDDYYESKEEYARYLSHYIDFAGDGEPTFAQLVNFCKYTLEDGRMIDIYADEKNPKVLRNVEIARMYAGGDVILKGIERIDAKTIRGYYEKRENVSQILSKGLCANKDEQNTVVKQQQLKGQLTLNDVTEAFSLVNDLLGQLVSLAYLRERDKMYLLLGYYYMAMRNPDSWGTEVIDTLDADSIKVSKGLVLYQVVGMFDFGTPFLYLNSEKKWEKKTGMSIGMKEERFEKMHTASMACAMQLFEQRSYEASIRNLRNYVDHFKYYLKFDKSIMELYGEFYTQFFTYSSKLRKSVIFNFKNILEKFFLDAEVKLLWSKAEDETALRITKLMSQKFTYKLKPDKGGKQETCEGNAKSYTFIKAVKEILEYSQKKSAE